MNITARVFAKTFVQTKPGVEKESYLKQFAIQALTVTEHPLYSRDVELELKELDPAPQDFASRLLIDSELASNIPLVPASKDADVKFDDLLPEVKRIYENYPLAFDERISSIKMLCLESDWEGMARGTLFFERETNLSRVYFAVPRFRSDPQIPGLTPALLLGVGSVPVDKGAAATDGSGNHMVLAASSTDDNSMSDFAGTAFSLTLDTISTLSWATPAGPFVSAYISFFKAIMGDGFGEKFDLMGAIQKIADDVVKRIEYFQENQELKDSLDGLKVFSDWLSTLDTVLDTQSRETFRLQLLEASGVLSQLNDTLGPNIKNNLFHLKSTLFRDADLQAGDVYGSPHRWSQANTKLHLLLLVTSQYLMALKLKIVLIARLYQSGYDILGNSIEPTVSDPDNTLDLLIKEMKDFQKKLPEFIANVRSRRQGMVTLAVKDCLVAYSREQKPVARRGEWNSRMNKHDALYRGSRNDQMVRSIEDNPGVWEFEWTDSDIYDLSGGAYRNKTKTIIQYSWKRTEIQDKAIYNGKEPQDWVLSNGDYGSWTYEHNTARAEALKNEYLSRILKSFDEGVKIPSILESNIRSLLDKWKPQLPMKLPDTLGLDIASWGDTAKADELWADKTITVRYRFTLRSTIGNESEKSNDITSTKWLEPKGNRPDIIGLPAQGEYLEYVHSICLYRQFRKELRDGSYKYSPDRKVAVLNRVEGKEGFAGRIVDKASTKHDSEQLSER